MKSLHTLAICATIFFVGFSCSKAINNGSGPTGKTGTGEFIQESGDAFIQEKPGNNLKWEYGKTSDTSVKGLNVAGKEGWELVCFDKDGTAVFIRQLN